ncbi:16S rRNA m(2)G 1207 methyltransferase [Vreelandella songnenensis]|uniref:16S rRNA m(2)G 1207 methyltransferase n=1 Tax=Vreelandella songnenensis TaxID=1176243 RepID=A0A2T0V869_9GAMM|nr:methyltransferase [Halomonas songnenensis]PRY66248.1 16S rRNA m(2)G 1207 methyltransferase [Halomonas songnenensis]
MSAQLPACQLLERQQSDYTHHFAIAPPLDTWLVEHTLGAVSGDLNVVEAWDERGKLANSPFALSASFDRAVLFWPKALKLGIWWVEWLCETLPEETSLEIVGEHNGGIKRVPKVLEELGMACDKLDNARRCSLYATRTVKRASDAVQAAWQHFDALGLTLVSHPGVFGHGKLDEGTQLLLESLASRLPKVPRRILDMGCGDGIISAWLASKGHTVTAVDVSDFAVEATRRTLAANALEGRVLQSDVYSALDGETFDLIISNPPFHQERDVSYGPSQRLIQKAPEQLARGGQFIIVANGFLPYPALLESSFGSFEVLADNRRFRVYAASK